MIHGIYDDMMPILIAFKFVLLGLFMFKATFFNYNVFGCRLMVLKISSKFELRRFCRTTGTVAMVSRQHIS